VSRDKILHDSWSISAALAGVSPIRHFERGEGPGNEVAKRSYNLLKAFDLTALIYCYGWNGLIKVPLFFSLFQNTYF